MYRKWITSCQATHFTFEMALDAESESRCICFTMVDFK